MFDLFHDLNQEANVVFWAAAVFVLALVRQRRKELVDQQPVTGLQLYGIEAGVLGPLRRSRILSNDLLNLGMGERLRHEPVLWSGHSRRGHRRLPFDMAQTGVHPRMSELHSNSSPVLVDSIGQTSQPRDKRVIVDAWLGTAMAGQWVGDTSILDGDQPHASPGPLGVVED